MFGCRTLSVFIILDIFFFTNLCYVYGMYHFSLILTASYRTLCLKEMTNELNKNMVKNKNLCKIDVVENKKH